ncbi:MULTISPECIES: glycosyltransferase family 2 protein [Dyadobacter]|uniref:Glycosyltransferase n=1 Tax=Dyadobacter chenhuakuii TaxID=2909339 RepID=A0ABY4XSD3_9BACT|nr:MULTISPECIES: glycosyltransferase family 2 protein [Dyadobacter]MCE7070273.1 glycosyltransferase [Dyadobacter sp. CY327]MCF2492572.1 glycosyltransferase [Dyadobacter chenhuakuii]MCF2520411.1 glycosyltransferase [Dyadobacter sp. CY351]USJ33133.1 glycosyltransferase [Dyadobacter chenhuakuii]
MNLSENPEWLTDYSKSYKKFEEIPQHVFDSINKDLKKIISDEPVVTVLIAAWNEEINILNCISSLSKTVCDYPLEIIVVNNNSKDRTQDTIDKLAVKGLFEQKQGCGPARQHGQLNAKGKYVLLADADCFYPSCWVQEMIRVLSKPDVVCVYGRYSFISEQGFPRWKLGLLETGKDIISEVRQINRPYYNAYGISMGYIRELGLKVGFINDNFWGDDGQLCLGLMKYGKIRQVRSNKARAWTGIRTLQRDGDTFTKVFMARINKERKRFLANFNSRLPEEGSYKKPS